MAKMSYDDLGTFPLSLISYHIVKELPKNVSKKRTYSIQYSKYGADITRESDGVYARLVNYKNRATLYLYEVNKDLFKE